MSALVNRTSRLPMSRPNILKALRRISAELENIHAATQNPAAKAAVHKAKAAVYDAMLDIKENLT